MLSRVRAINHIVNTGKLRFERLQCAVARGDLQEVKHWIEVIGFNIDFTKNNLLITASKNRHTDVVRYLISKGADFTYQGCAPMRLAAKNGHLDTFKFLVEIGSDITTDKCVAFQSAYAWEHIEILRYMMIRAKLINISLYDTYQTLLTTLCNVPEYPQCLLIIIPSEHLTSLTERPIPQKYSVILQHLALESLTQAQLYCQTHKFDENVEGKFINTVFAVSKRQYHLIDKSMVCYNKWPNLAVTLAENNILTLNQDVLEKIFMFAYECESRETIFYPLRTPQPKTLNSKLLSHKANRYFTYSKLFPIQDPDSQMEEIDLSIRH